MDSDLVERSPLCTVITLFKARGDSTNIRPRSSVGYWANLRTSTLNLARALRTSTVEQGDGTELSRRILATPGRMEWFAQSSETLWISSF